jgi:hypothetical protein
MTRTLHKREIYAAFTQEYVKTHNGCTPEQAEAAWLSMEEELFFRRDIGPGPLHTLSDADFADIVAKARL